MMQGKGGAYRLPLLFMMLALAAGVPPAASSGEGTYRRPLTNDPATLDPARVGDIYSRSVSQQIFDGLVQFDQTLTVTPALAQHWKASRDGLVWTFTLRRGVKFHHGREMTADDVVYSLTRLADPRTRSAAADLFLNVKGAPEFREGRAKSIEGLSALDRYTVQVTLQEALVPFVSVLAVGHAKIVPREVVETMGDAAFGSAPVGTGPFAVGFSVERRGEGWYFMHGGSNWGFQCDVLLHRLKGYGVAIMTNSDSGGAIIREIEARIAAAYGWDSLDKAVPR